MRKCLPVKATVFGLGLAAALSARGDTLYTNEADFVTAIGGALSYLNDFSDLTNNDAFAHPLNCSSNGIAYAITSIPLIKLVSIVGALSTWDPTDDILVTFTSGNIGAAGGWFYLVDDTAAPVTGTVSITVSNSTTATIVTNASSTPPFFIGLVSSGLFLASLRIHSETPAGYPALDHLYVAQVPQTLAVAPLAAGGVTVSWPAAATGYVLQTTSQSFTTNWTNVTVAPQQVGNLMQVVLPNSFGQAFYRLLKQ
jgi:hypothetical protein